MPPIRTIHSSRIQVTSSTLSRSSSTSSSATSTNTELERSSSDSLLDLMRIVPYAAQERKTRKRITASQLEKLEKLFGEVPKPTREQREELARETKMEPKAVTTWFQNKRQNIKRSSTLTVLNNSTNTRSSIRAQTPPPFPLQGLRLPRGSLERVASLSELPSPPPRSMFSSYHPDHEKHLWNHMLSSPPAPVSRGPEKGEQWKLLGRSRGSKRTLEWACANARGKVWSDGEGDTDDEDDEAKTPSEGNSLDLIIVETASQDGMSGMVRNLKEVDIRPESGKDREMEAALALCGLLRG